MHQILAISLFNLTPLCIIEYAHCCCCGCYSFPCARPYEARKANACNLCMEYEKWFDPISPNATDSAVATNQLSISVFMCVCARASIKVSFSLFLRMTIYPSICLYVWMYLLIMTIVAEWFVFFLYGAFALREREREIRLVSLKYEQRVAPSS